VTGCVTPDWSFDLVTVKGALDAVRFAHLGC
jgi:hypothetical protein